MTATLAPVPLDLLEALAASSPAGARSSAQRSAASGGGGAGFDLERWIAGHGLDASGPLPWQGGRRWVLAVCPWNPDHRDRAAYIVQLTGGGIDAGCHHNGCAGKDWRALRDAVEPGWRDAYPSGGAGRGAPRRPFGAADEGWPDPPGPAAFHGLAGRVVEAVEPHTEADPIALLVSFLIAFGCAVGRGPHAMVGASRHAARESAVLVGRSAKARKGDSWQPNSMLLRMAEPAFGRRILGGLASGEGLIWAVRDPIEKTEPIKEKGRVVGYETVVVDPGEPDKRLLVIEPEAARVLRVMGRQGASCRRSCATPGTPATCAT